MRITFWLLYVITTSILLRLRNFAWTNLYYSKCTIFVRIFFFINKQMYICDYKRYSLELFEWLSCRQSDHKIFATFSLFQLYWQLNLWFGDLMVVMLVSRWLVERKRSETDQNEINLFHPINAIKRKYIYETRK